ncbi:MAG TPA: hypothetical protein VJB94_03320 [Candidatus Nanoarchaeia archaeon]|nr:hypothetical protein [Candidatus Nanoarchaeia archaeon]
MATTIQVSEKLQQELNKRKLYDKETYEEVIWGVMEDSMELNEETKKDIKEARLELKEGKGIPLSEVKKKLGL